MELTTIWFILIAVLWIGYFTLDGFDLGVGTLFPVLGRDSKDGKESGETRRRQMLGAIGPVWDGNEVWLLTAGGAMFAAFPHWYATLFSGFYLALFLILLALIVRGCAFDYRSKKDSATWRARWDAGIVFGSALPALLWGVAFTNILRGVPIDENMTFTGNLLTLLNPVALLGGLVTLVLFAAHGAMFIALKTDGSLRHDARALSVKLGLGAAVLAVPWLVIIHVEMGDVVSWAFFALAALALLGGVFAAAKGREGWGFTGTFVAIALAVASLFKALFPNVMPSSTDEAYNLTVHNASSTDLTLQIMTVVALVFTPIVLAYTAWTYWAFRKRISGHHIPGPDHGARDEDLEPSSSKTP